MDYPVAVGTLLLLLTSTEILCDGRWDQWSDSTPCSRTCGGGVQSRSRGCIRTSSGNGNGCSGPAVKYSSCNTQICPESSDFREDQCGEFNGTEVMIRGRYESHGWIPHFDENNRCSLKCRAVGTRVVRELSETVVDGTSCDNPDGFGICIAGVCQPVGCDRVIGSSTQEDKCRVCGGDGSACKSHAGHFTKHKLNVGYHEFLTIPQGATTIVVEETTESINYFTVRTSGGHYHLNGGRDRAGQKAFAGTVFKYTNEKSDHGSLESITARGPTNETLVFVLATRDGKAGVHYEYSMPQTILHKASPSDRYTWVHGRWTGCSRECGTGYQLRAISCIDRETGRSVGESLCPRREIPMRNQTCFNGPCAKDRTNGYSWVLGHWGECSVTCGVGEQTQLAYCQEKGTMGQTIYVSDNICVRYLHPKPQYKRVCEDSSGCPLWATSPWSECNVTCGYGYQTRRVYCQQEADSPNDVPLVLSDRRCRNLDKPREVKACQLSPCPDGRNTRIYHRTTTQSLELEMRDEGRPVAVDCSSTSFGCCPDGQTAARAPHHQGCPTTQTDRCSLEQSRGPCGNYTLKWYFDSQTSTCNMFWYGSCGGNDNRFDSEEECENNCLKDNSEDNQIVSIECGTSDYGCCPDGQTSASGPNQEGCPDRVVPAHSACRSARYGCCEDGSTFATGPNKQGCPGSTPTPTDCRYSAYGCCPGTTTAAAGPGGEGCRGRSDAARSGFDTASCGKDKQTGQCSDYSIQWYYNIKMGSCTQFWYGGCGGNDNRFLNKTDCEAACIHVRGTAVCRLPVTSGPCKAAHPRFYFDYTTGECRPFTYGGCHGNANRFQSRKECEMKCSDSPFIDSEEDERPAVVGGCRSTQYGCCGDGVTAKVNAYDTCGSRSCQTSRYGCCEDGRTPASGPDYEGCDPVGSGDEPCHDSYYGCCPDGVTMATGPDGQGCQSEATTTPAPVARENEDVCRQEKSQGRCKDYVVQWFFDPAQQRCDRFWYGGCEDSGNHFADEASCRGRCLSVVQTTAPPTTPRPRPRLPVCDQPKEVGPCKAVLQRWYYDRYQRRCASFLYGGCHGNDNNFRSESLCQRACQTSVTTPTPTVAEAKSTMTMSGTDSVLLGQAIQLKCVATPRGGQTADDIEWFHNGEKVDPQGSTSQLKVVQRLAVGTRNQVAELTVYNADATHAGTYYCRSMPFGVVDSMRVQVLTEHKTESPVTRAPAVTQPVSTDPGVICMERKKTGNCYALIPRWFYEHKQGKCQQFQYGGCGGNSNNFESQSDCEATCSADNICKLPSVTGRCRGYFRRWFYDSQTKACQEFVYGGCEGNPNNFETQTACEDKCSRPTKTESPVTGTAVCSLPRSSGNCNGYNIVWYYDLDLQRCRRFIYTGCGGNENRFETDAECLQLCDGVSKDGLIVRPTQRSRVTARPIPQATPRPTYRPTPRPTPRPTYRPTTVAPAVAVDTCTLPSDNGRCPSGSNYTIWWHFDSDKSYCTRFYYGGCGGNANRFHNKEDCENECLYGNKGEQTTPYPGPALTTAATPADCHHSRYGCCDDGHTTAVDSAHSNCFGDEPNVIERVEGDRTLLLVRQGRTVTLSCKLTSNSLYNDITWYRDGFLLRSSNRFNILYNGSLTITHVSHRDSGAYACRVNGGNRLGQVQRFKVHVRVPLRIQSSPEKIIVKPGENAFLHCQVFGNPQPRVTWTKNGRKVVTNGRHHAFDNGTLIITTVREHDIGDYECRADNGISGSATRTVALVIKDTVTARLDPYKGKVIEGGTIRLRCKGKGHPRPRLAWEKDGAVLESDDRVYLTHGELVIRNAVLDDSGVYTCVVSNGREEARATTTVQVTMPQLSDKCENSLSEMNCKIILRAGLCGHRMFSKMCCVSCRRRHG